MPSTYTTSLRLEEPGDGEQNTTWGDTLNRDLSLIDQAIAGWTVITLTTTSYTLSARAGQTDESRLALVVFIGNPGAAATVTLPASTKLTRFSNQTAWPVKLTTGAPSPAATLVLHPQCGTTAFCDGTNVAYADWFVTSQLQALNLDTASPTASGTGPYGQLAYNFGGQNLGPGWAAAYSLLATNIVIGLQFLATSDRRKKRDIAPLDAASAIADVETLAGLVRGFAYRSDGRRSAGWIAQDLLKAGLTELVTAVSDPDMQEDVDPDGFVSPAGSRLVFDPEAILPRLVVAVADLRARATRPWWRRLFG